MLKVYMHRRYARALIAASSDTKASLDMLREQLQALAQLFETVRELKEIALDPSYSRAEKMAIVNAVLGSAGPLDPMIANLMRLLVDRHRLQYLSDISRLFRDQVDMLSGRVQGRLVTAGPLDPAPVEKPEARRALLARPQDMLPTTGGPSILGGAAAEVGKLVNREAR